jgi:hypothetical protein
MLNAKRQLRAKTKQACLKQNKAPLHTSQPQACHMYANLNHACTVVCCGGSARLTQDDASCHTTHSTGIQLHRFTLLHPVSNNTLACGKVAHQHMRCCTHHNQQEASSYRLPLHANYLCVQTSNSRTLLCYFSQTCQSPARHMPAQQ